KKQMSGYTGILSFEIIESVNVGDFLKRLKMIRPSMSLAGVESTILSPTKTSHALLSSEERKRQGISDGLLRFSVGLEVVDEIIESVNVGEVFKRLQMLPRSMSLAGVESTILSPTKTSLALLSSEERKRQGISDGLLRFSVGIEEVEDIIADLEGAFTKLKLKSKSKSKSKSN